MAGPIIELPLTDSLSEVMRGFIELIECQFQISYPTTGLAASPQIREHPALINIIKVIHKVVEQHTAEGRNGCRLLIL
ncbi:hypothetical protein CCACVL1_19127 [Corchorus capsularis]|uniref:Uncharacterized protein n=1 Tax=Corchorus capsularis TaxID=210143 RepID=A0A1R3HIE6_COCAP|nr:hypothetical protein CCACVL1_19127 [Corchorus capsularis]